MNGPSLRSLHLIKLRILQPIKRATNKMQFVQVPFAAPCNLFTESPICTFEALKTLLVIKSNFQLVYGGHSNNIIHYIAIANALLYICNIQHIKLAPLVAIVITGPSFITLYILNKTAICVKYQPGLVTKHFNIHLNILAA